MNTTSRTASLSRDLLLPDLFCDTSEGAARPPGEASARASETPPEHRLMIALMRDAIRCIERYRCACDSLGRRRFEQELDWILSDDTDRLYAFARICETLGLEPDAVRRSLGLVVERRQGESVRGVAWPQSFAARSDDRERSGALPRRAARPLSRTGASRSSLSC